MYYPSYVQCSIPSSVGTQKIIQPGFFLENLDLFTWKFHYQIENLGTKIKGI